MRQEEQTDFINLLRGLAIFFMLWGHCIQFCCGGQFDFFENGMFKFIYSFHMPLFMVISGYLFFYSAKKRELVELIQYKAKSLLYPILMGSVINLVLTAGVMLIKKGDVGEIKLTSLWFLWSVLSASVVFAFVVKCKIRLLQFLIAFLGIVAVAFFPCREMNVYMYPYFVMGCLFARFSKRISKKVINVAGFISLACYVFMLLLFEKKYYIYTSGIFGGRSLLESLQIDGFRWLIGLFGSIAIIWLCFLVNRKCVGTLFYKLLDLLGKNSLAVYVFSASLLSCYLPWISRVLLNWLPWIDWNACIIVYWIITFAVAVFYALLILWIVKLLKRSKTHSLILGR